MTPAGNPFLRLRLGQVQVELGALDEAADNLTRAYMGGGREHRLAPDSRRRS